MRADVCQPPPQTHTFYAKSSRPTCAAQYPLIWTAFLESLGLPTDDGLMHLEASDFPPRATFDDLPTPLLLFTQGIPGAGKSFLAGRLVAALNAAGIAAVQVAQDDFAHLGKKKSGARCFAHVKGLLEGGDYKVSQPWRRWVVVVVVEEKRRGTGKDLSGWTFVPAEIFGRIPFVVIHFLFFFLVSTVRVPRGPQEMSNPCLHAIFFFFTPPPSSLPHRFCAQVVILARNNGNGKQYRKYLGLDANDGLCKTAFIAPEEAETGPHLNVFFSVFVCCLFFCLFFSRRGGG